MLDSCILLGFSTAFAMLPEGSKYQYNRFPLLLKASPHANVKPPKGVLILGRWFYLPCEKWSQNHPRSGPRSIHPRSPAPGATRSITNLPEATASIEITHFITFSIVLYRILIRNRYYEKNLKHQSIVL